MYYGLGVVTPTILAATIGVTFVGPRNYPQRTMPGFLRVNRVCVRRALEWLKDNNHLYADITISEERLAALPDDEVPMEITSLVKYSNDTKLLVEENDGYVPPDEANESGTFPRCTKPKVFTLWTSL